MTIFATLSILLVASFLFVLLEAGRQHQLRLTAQLNTESVLESVFANYCSPMWEMYRILVLDNGQEEEQGAFAAWEWYARELSEENVSPRQVSGSTSHLRMKTEQVTFEEYRLITDDEGRAYIAAVSSYMRNHLTEKVMEELAGQYGKLIGMEISNTPDSSAIDDADSAMEEAKRAEDEMPPKASEIEVEESPLEVVKDLWSKGILTLVIEDTKSISKAKEKMSDAVSKRKLKVGNYSRPVETDWMDSLLLSQYLLDHFACYTEGTASGSHQYELEYILCGNAKDQDNLCETVEWLLALREAANLAYLATDVQKQELAYSVAVALVGATVNPAIIYAVKCGVLAAWALVESILDVRALLAGDKIAIIKSSGQWTSDLLHLGSSFASFGKAADCANGLSYKGYLGFLLMANEKKTCYRAMDLQEAAIRKTEGNEDFCMDHMVTDAILSIDYRYQTIFLGMDELTSRMKSSLVLYTQKEFSYRKAGV